MSSEDTLRSILIAGVGNAWLHDDGFGGEVARRLEQDGLPAGVSVMDAGTGGLDLAYEVMRGYDGLIILDVSKQGGEPGTLYVMEPDEDEVAGGIEDGEVINPHGMDPQTVLRFVKSIGAWPGRVVVIACEPAQVEEMGWGLSDEVQAAVERAAGLVRGDRGRALRRDPGGGGGVSRARALPGQRDRQHRGQARARPPGDGGEREGRTPAPGDPGHAVLLFRVRGARIQCVRGHSSSSR